MTDWYKLSAEDVVRHLGTDAAAGLTDAAAAQRLAQDGPNELRTQGVRGAWRILWSQLTATLMLLLIVAAAISAIIGDDKNALAILAIVILNASLGFSQEQRAEKAMAALKQLAVPTVKVRRNGQAREISARELVRGDIFLLESGNLVPADGRLLSAFNLRVQAAALTGESEPVDKDPAAVGREDVPLAERDNLVHMGTLVSYGRGEAVVTETGMATELGRIAHLIQTTAHEPTPLQRRLDHLGRRLAVFALIIVGIIFALGVLRGVPIKLMFLTAVSIAVAAVPEGLPAAVTVALALGAQRMLKRHALIRKLPAVEALGSVTVICADKTGTLTGNRMTVTMLDVAGHRVDLLDPATSMRDRQSQLEMHPALAALVAGGALCNDALLQSNGADGVRALGDPTEAALVIAAARFGLLKPELEHVLPRQAEVPFDSHRKRMTTVHRLAAPAPAALPVLSGAAYLGFTKGAVDGVLAICTHMLADHRPEPLSPDWRTRILAANDEMAREGMRVLGVAFRRFPSAPAECSADSLERDLVFVGLLGLIDPPRPEAKSAVQSCRDAGIRPIMITGDHVVTARHIAQTLGITTSDSVITGADLQRARGAELDELVCGADVYARVAPEHKLQIVDALQRRGDMVAMTGDGINDAPALKKADIGVAMGVTGTDVAKEAADIVLLDDNFATIVAAVEEGRVIYDNIRKFIKYLMTTNSAELGVMLLGPVFGMPLPLLPLQILWMNLVTDGPPALALSVEPAEPQTMHRPPQRPAESIFAGGMGRHIVWVGMLMVVVALAPAYWLWQRGEESWQTMLFTTLSISQMGHVLAIRTGQQSLFRAGLLSNTPLLGAAILTVVLQLVIVYVPFAQRIFDTVPLGPHELALALVLSTVIFGAVELEKWVLRRARR